MKTTTHLDGDESDLTHVGSPLRVRDNGDAPRNYRDSAFRVALRTAQKFADDLKG